jgi:proline-specific peptidase
MKNTFCLVFILFYHFVLIAQKNDSIAVSNAVLHYSVQGEGQPILLLSGGPGISSGQLSSLSERLSKNYKCILFDQRGTAKSHTNPMDSTTINLDQSMKDINLLLERLNFKKTTIIGHSWGAMLAISYAIKYPDHVARLVLIGPGPLELSDYNILEDNLISRVNKEEKIFVKQADDSIANHTASKELLKAYRTISFRCFLFDPLTVDSLSEIITRNVSRNDSMNKLMIRDLRRINYNVKPGIPKLNMPILTICGRQDPVGIFPTFTIEELNKKAKIVWIDKSGHFPWVERPDSFYPELLDFIK